jgi:hypothetical protein
MDTNSPSTSGIAILLQIVGWATTALSALYAGYSAMVASSGGTPTTWALPIAGVVTGLLFVAIAAILEKLTSIETLLLKEARARNAVAK